MESLAYFHVGEQDRRVKTSCGFSLDVPTLVIFGGEKVQLCPGAVCLPPPSLAAPHRAALWVFVCTPRLLRAVGFACQNNLAVLCTITLF